MQTQRIVLKKDSHKIVVFRLYVRMLELKQ